MSEHRISPQTGRSAEWSPFTAQRIKSYVNRVKSLVEEQKALGVDISEVCKEAKKDGLDPTTLRFAAREALMDSAKRADRDGKRDQYLHALGLAVAAVESGELSARQSAKVFGIGKTSIYNALSVREVSAARELADGDLGEWEPPRPTTKKAEQTFGETLREKMEAAGLSVCTGVQPSNAAPDPDDDMTPPLHLRRPSPEGKTA
jgi:uncharacterized protein (UPF0335 family)